MNESQYPTRNPLPVLTRTLKRAASVCAMAALIAPLAAPQVMAQELDSNARSAAIVIDAQTGEVLYARRAGEARYPASLTKVMTLYMAFEALASGQIKPTDMITMSRHANSQEPVKVGFRDGDTISVDMAIKLTSVYSANDLAVGLAEKIGGSEERFTALMTIRAQELGMNSTRFVNANGLPDARQLSSARDFAILMRSVLRDYPQYYSYLNVRSVEYNGRTFINHNPVKDLDGVDGGKTGFTRAAGYNLVVSQTKGDRRLIAVMLGSSNKEARRETITAMMDSGFDVINRRAGGERIEVAQAEIGGALSRRATFMPSQPQPYTVLADAGMSESQLRQTLASSEEANAAEDVERLSSTASAPAVARALSGSAPMIPTASAALASATPSPVPSTAKPYVPSVEKASLNTTPAMPTKPKAAAEDDCATATKASAKTSSAKAKTVKTSAKTKATASKASAKCKVKKDPNAIWAIQVGAFKQKSQANEWAVSIKKRFKPQLAKLDSDVSRNEHGWYRTRFVELTEAQAKAACKAIDAKRLDCSVVKPST